MDTRPIGIIDSGLGGLTGLMALRALLPEEDLIFFGDTGRMPYGGRPKEQLRRMGQQNLDFMAGLDVKAMRTQPDEDCYRHLINSKRIFELLLEKVKKFDYKFQAECVKNRNLEKLEMYVLELLMGA